MNRAAARLATLAWICLAGPSLAQTDPGRDPEVRVEDVVVTGQRGVHETARDFVAGVAAAPQGRELAVWRESVCVGVIGLPAQPAGAMADRVSDWAHSLGVRVSSPGCRPNIVILATNDASAAARDLVAARPRDFRTGTTGTSRGPSALRAFQQSDLPVRWWHVSLPVDEFTRRSTVRGPGTTPFSAPRRIINPMDLGDIGRPVLASRLLNQDQDDLKYIVILIDPIAFDRATFGQVADYVSMIALAQVDPEAAPSAPSILNLFGDEEAEQNTLSPWDLAYLRAIYGTRIAGDHRNISTIATATAREVQQSSDAEQNR